MTEAIKIRYCLGEPFDVIYPVESNVAFSAKKPANASLATFSGTATRMIVVNAETCMPLSVFRFRPPAYSATSSLGRAHLLNPPLVDVILREGHLAYFSLFPFWTTATHQLGIRLKIFFSVPLVFYFSLLLMSLIGVLNVLPSALSVLFYPLIMRFSGALLAPGVPPVLSVTKPMEQLEGEFLKTTKTLTRSRVRLFERGHCRSSQRLGFVRRLQRLTPSFYHLEAIYGR